MTGTALAPAPVVRDEVIAEPAPAAIRSVRAQPKYYRRLTGVSGLGLGVAVLWLSLLVLIPLASKVIAPVWQRLAAVFP